MDLNLPTIIIAVIIAVIFVSIIVHGIRKKKKGCSGCSCGCGNCDMECKK